MTHAELKLWATAICTTCLGSGADEFARACSKCEGIGRYLTRMIEASPLADEEECVILTRPDGVYLTAPMRLWAETRRDGH